jgi:hypothetical protein
MAINVKNLEKFSGYKFVREVGMTGAYLLQMLGT